MHCLGAVSSGSASPQRAGNCGSVLGVVRALGVLVSEGRVQGPPRGYKEGPHCAAPLQPAPNDHVCEKDNYLCDRYVILVREIADRVTTCSYLCIEVLLCADCPCGLAKATSKDPVLPIPSMSIAPWQQSSEMLLEYWCISVVPSKGPEMMNNQSLYQAVRSRLHFSQVAAWWSRSKGAAPSYVTTRVVSFSEENLRKFRETPSEHTFPLAACGDGNSIKVTVWALPRIEDVPLLNCPLHLISEKEDEGAARALTPTKNILMPTTSTNTAEALVLPTLVDDRLQTPCNEPGKHHCRCEEEDGCPPPSLRANGERKRRRSLPRGPDFIPGVIPHSLATAASFLPSVCEIAAREHENKVHLRGWLAFENLNYNETRYPESETTCLNADADPDNRGHQIRSSTLPISSNEQSNAEAFYLDNQTTTNSSESTETFGLQLINLQEEESNDEKRYKWSIVPSSIVGSGKSSCDNRPYGSRRDKSPKLVKKDHLARRDETTTLLGASGQPILFQNNRKTLSGKPSSFTTAHLVGEDPISNINWTTSTISGRETEFGEDIKEKPPLNVPIDTLPISHSKPNLVINPFSESSPFHESNPGPSTYIDNYWGFQGTSNPYDKHHLDHGDKDCNVESTLNDGSGVKPIQNISGNALSVSNNDLSNLMVKLKLPEETAKVKDERSILDWISRVPNRVFNVSASNGFTDYKSKANDDRLEERCGENEAKSKQNCNLELSKREFDEVLAVLRAQTPAGRRRTPLRTLKRREKLGKQTEEGMLEQNSIFKKVVDSNLNASGYSAHKNGQRAAIAARLGIVQFASNGNDQSVAGPEKREPAEIFSSNMKKVCPREKLDKPGAEPTQCFYNVTNQADVLLGAILRSSNDSRKGLFDISNGARPRKILSSENCDIKSDVYIREAEKAKRNIGGVKPYEDVRSSLPSSLNKRISQFKQLFKKDQDKKDWENHSKESDAGSDRLLDASELCTSSGPMLFQKTVKDSRVKRRIDFSNFPEPGCPNEYLPVNDNETNLDTNRVYQNRLFRGKNHHVENGYPVNISDRVLPGINHETTGEEGSHFTPTSMKSSINLKLKIGHKPTENCFDEYGANYNNCDSVFSQVDKGVEKDLLLPTLQENDSCTDMDNNDASDKGVPSAIEQERFRRSLGNAASMVFHSRTGLPLTSSPAPLRRGSCCFDYDSSLNSVSSKRSALFELNTPPSPGAVSLEEGDRETENTCEGEETVKRRTASRGLPHSHALLGSFEESALNGRLEPVSTVHGFTAELGASGSFCPKHRKLPVTVFFYTLGDNDKVSTPYLAHINLGKKGYQVPRSGTIQVTLLNPLGTVVKMFVVMYDLSDMPSRSHTFLRQRTLRDKTLRYLIHLRFMSGKSGRIYLHTDIRMIICRKSDVDTASDFGAEPPKELRSFVHGPTNPKFSPRC